MSESDNVLLELRGLKKYFDVTEGWFNKDKKYLHAVDGVDLKVMRGETFSIVGESGCGKSTLGNIIMSLLEPTEGSIIFDSVDLSKLSKEELRKKRADMQMVFQDPFSSLNPRMRVFDIIAEPIRTHNAARGKALEKRILELMDVVGLDRGYAMRYPHEFSGGQRQRIGIARALALNPKLIICDEPVSALDVSIQAQILNLLARLQKELKLTYVFIAHGLPVVKHISDRIAVMYMGKIMETAPKGPLFEHQYHPYTAGLIASVPIADPNLRVGLERTLLSGELPSPVNPPDGCRFYTRCKYAQPICKEHEPVLEQMDTGHFVACHFPIFKEGAVQ
ncbi:MAG: ATP-binding cassette domain-containing protein [Clostridia bacterium]